MGSRTVVTTPDKKMSVYLRWNGGQDSVKAFLHYCELHGFRSPGHDPYGWVRLCQVISNFFDGGLGARVGLYDQLDANNWDNGVYIIEGQRIVGHEFNRYAEQNSYDHMDMLYDINDSQPEGMRLGRYTDAIEVPVSKVEEGGGVWLGNLRNGFESCRVHGFAEPPSLRGTRKWLPFVERCDAGEKREAVLRSPDNSIRGTTVRVIR